jgi:hypothetical protein
MPTDLETLHKLLLEMLVARPWLIAAPACAVLQCVAILRYRGVVRALSVILAVMTGAACGLAIAAYAMDPGNLWQLFLMFSTPPLFVLSAGVLAIGLIAG